MVPAIKGSRTIFICFTAPQPWSSRGFGDPSEGDWPLETFFRYINKERRCCMAMIKDE